MGLIRQIGTSEDGYTLLETVVAMSIFLAVAIPLVSVLAKITLDRSPEDIREALLMVQSEISRIEAGTTIKRGLESHRLVLNTSIRDTLSMKLVQVRVLSRKDSTKVVLHVEKLVRAVGPL